MKLLALDTSTEACSVALWLDGEVHERFEIAPRRHTELVLPWTDALLAEAGIGRSQLDAIAVARGPGAFTGVRLAVALTQGIALALDRPVVPVSTLAALALPALAAAPAAATGVLAAIDARMGEIYFGLYGVDVGQGAIALAPEWMATAAAPALPITGRWLGVGSGLSAEGSTLIHSLGEHWIAGDPTALPRAGDVARLAVPAFERGEAIAADALEPAYLRNKVALTLAEQQAARG